MAKAILSAQEDSSSWAVLRRVRQVGLSAQLYGVGWVASMVHLAHASKTEKIYDFEATTDRCTDRDYYSRTGV